MQFERSESSVSEIYMRSEEKKFRESEELMMDKISMIRPD